MLHGKTLKLIKLKGSFKLVAEFSLINEHNKARFLYVEPLT